MNGTDILVKRRSVRPRITQEILANRVGMRRADLIALENNRVCVTEEKMREIMTAIDEMATSQEERQCREVTAAA
jgi:DNA-binding XRE family transcriptional regulator